MKRVILSICIFLHSLAGISQQRLINKSLFNHKDGIALEQYDAVEYVKNNKAVRGTKEFSAKVDGISFYFVSLENQWLFEKNPLQYLPQYGGWCAYAMGKNGEKVDIDPHTFKIVEGKLYLFYNRFFNNTLKSWNKNEKELLKNADSNWKKIK